MIKLVLTDLDDTLIPFDPSGAGHGASSHACAAIHEALGAGVRVGPVTGRMPHSMAWMFSGDEACYQTAAFVNGQVVRLDGRTVFERGMTGEELAAIDDVLEQTDFAYLALYDEGDVRLVSADAERVRKNPPPTFGVEMDAIVSEIPAVGCLKANIQCACDYGRMAELRDELRDAVPSADFVLPSLVAAVIDVLPGDWGKAEAVRLLARELGAGIDEVAVFGDSDNDLAMIEAVPNSVAVANASDAVRAAARWHIGASADGAVAGAISAIARAARAGEMPEFMR